MNTGSPVGVTALGGCGAFQRWDLVLRSGSEGIALVPMFSSGLLRCEETMPHVATSMDSAMLFCQEGLKPSDTMNTN